MAAQLVLLSLSALAEHPCFAPYSSSNNELPILISPRQYICTPPNQASHSVCSAFSTQSVSTHSGTGSTRGGRTHHHIPVLVEQVCGAGAPPLQRQESAGQLVSYADTRSPPECHVRVRAPDTSSLLRSQGSSLNLTPDRATPSAALGPGIWALTRAEGEVGRRGGQGVVGMKYLLTGMYVGFSL